MKIINYEEKEMIPLTYEENIPIIIHNASYDTYFIINQLAEESKGELNCIGENMKKNISLVLYQLRKNVMVVKQLHAN